MVTMHQLPPAPDPQTGEPKPPDSPFQQQHDLGDRTPSRVPDPPEGQGPVLACHREPALAVWLSAPVPPLLLLVIFVLTNGLVALTYWFTWVILFAYFAFLVYRGRSDVLTSGADWVKYRNTWVRTYELVRIHYTPAAQGMRHDVVLDESDHGVVIPVKVLQSNKQPWNYVHLGMRHSVANGAKVTRSARNQFPELYADETPSSTDEAQSNGEHSRLNSRRHSDDE